MEEAFQVSKSAGDKNGIRFLCGISLYALRNTDDKPLAAFISDEKEAIFPNSKSLPTKQNG